MGNSTPISEGMLQELLTTIKKLETDVAVLQSHSGATGGTIPLTTSSHANLLQNSSKASGNPLKRQ